MLFDKDKKSFLIVFDDKNRINMVFHVKTKKVENKILLYLEPSVRKVVEYPQHMVVNCQCNDCQERTRFLDNSWKELQSFNGYGYFSEEPKVSFVCFRLVSPAGAEDFLEMVTGGKIKYIRTIDAKILSDPAVLPDLYGTNSNNFQFDNLLRNMGF